MDKIKKYDSGLTLIVNEGGAKSCFANIMAGVGSSSETKEIYGISHYIEHMNFKGTKRFSAFDISSEMEKLGTTFNAYTSTEVTDFYVHSLEENLERSFDILTDLVFNSVYSDDEAAKEKGVIIEEINMSNDSPDEVCAGLLDEAFFGNEGYGHAILGTAENVSKFTKSDVLSYKQKHYTPDNIVVCFSGNVSLERAEYLTEKYLIPQLLDGKKEEDKNFNVKNLTRSLKKTKKIEQVHICLGFNSAKYADDRRVYSEIASGILGGGMSSRLFQKVREELGLAYSVYSYTYRYKKAGMAVIYAGVNKDKYESAYEAILNVLKEASENGISDEEFERVKTGLIASTVFGEEQVSRKNDLFPKHYLLTNELYDFDKRLATIKAAAKSDVEEAMRLYSREGMSAAVVGANVKKLIL